jgi:hypothetical protein
MAMTKLNVENLCQSVLGNDFSHLVDYYNGYDVVMEDGWVSDSEFMDPVVEWYENANRITKIQDEYLSR